MEIFPEHERRSAIPDGERRLERDEPHGDELPRRHDVDTGETGGAMAPCTGYATNYAYCHYPQDLEMGYFFYCASYMENCVGVSDECDTMIEEWTACVSALDCAEFEIPGCPAELEALQMNCGC